MLHTYTVSFFGHRIIENLMEAEERLSKLLRELIRQKEYPEFLVGRDGDFDLLAGEEIRKAARNYGCGNTHLTLILPYMRAEFRDNEREYLNYYDAVEICAESAAAHFKSAIQLRNRSMVDRSDLIVCYISQEQGGAYRTVKYAEAQDRYCKA